MNTGSLSQYPIIMISVIFLSAICGLCCKRKAESLRSDQKMEGISSYPITDENVGKTSQSSEPNSSQVTEPNSAPDKDAVALSKERALEVAKEKARSEGYNISAYEITIKDSGEYWCVDFKNAASHLGRGQHFSVYVYKSSQRNPRIFHGR